MNGKKLVLTGLSAALVLSLAAEAFAKPRHGAGMQMAPEILFVRMLKQDDENKDGKISLEEAKAGADRLFTAIDTDKDGNITPGEMRAWHKQKREERKAERGKARAQQETAKADETKPEDGKKDGKRHHGERHHDGKGRHGAKWGPGGMMFRMADKDENGQVSRQEAADAAEAMFKRLDKNNDGVISIDDMPDR